MQMPRATQIDRGAVGDIESGDRVVFAQPNGSIDPLAFVKQPAAYVDDRPIKNPKRRVHKMNSKIDEATATRLLAIIEPCLLRTVGVVKNQVDGEDLAELISPHQSPDLL